MNAFEMHVLHNLKFSQELSPIALKENLLYLNFSPQTLFFVHK